MQNIDWNQRLYFQGDFHSYDEALKFSESFKEIGGGIHRLQF